MTEQRVAGLEAQLADQQQQDTLHTQDIVIMRRWSVTRPRSQRRLRPRSASCSLPGRDPDIPTPGPSTARAASTGPQPPHKPPSHHTVRRRPWTLDEVECFILATLKTGPGHWAEVKAVTGNPRSSQQLKDKWRTIPAGQIEAVRKGAVHGGQTSSYKRLEVEGLHSCHINKQGERFSYCKHMIKKKMSSQKHGVTF